MSNLTNKHYFFLLLKGCVATIVLSNVNTVLNSLSANILRDRLDKDKFIYVLEVTKVTKMISHLYCQAQPKLKLKRG